MNKTESFSNEIIKLSINGQIHEIDQHLVKKPLAQYLRENARLVGTKIVCAEGDCGACTVLVQKPNQNNYTYINSCIAPVFLFHHCSIITIEGLAHDEELSEVQKKMVEFHGGQCGFCTPGMTCAMACLTEDSLQLNQKITEKKAKNYLTGNLCRCTGYEPIINAATHIDVSQWRPLTERYPQVFQQEKIDNFTSEFIDPVTEQKSKVIFTTDLQTVLQIKNENPNIKLLAGATDLGVVVNKGKLDLSEVVSLQYIDELGNLKDESQGTIVGATVTLTQFENFIVKSHPELKSLLHVFASPQIKNQGTVVGNIMNGSPIGDTIPALMSLDAILHLQSINSRRDIPLREFYLGYKKMDILPNEICIGLTIPKHDQFWHFKFYKQSMRKDLDISAVTFSAAFQVKNSQIEQARIVFGGVGPVVSAIPEIEKIFISKQWQHDLFEQAADEVLNFIHPMDDLRGSKEYRKQLCRQLLLKCFYDLNLEIQP